MPAHSFLKNHEHLLYATQKSRHRRHSHHQAHGALGFMTLWPDPVAWSNGLLDVCHLFFPLHPTPQLLKVKQDHVFFKEMCDMESNTGLKITAYSFSSGTLLKNSVLNRPSDCRSCSWAHQSPLHCTLRKACVLSITTVGAAV